MYQASAVSPMAEVFLTTLDNSSLIPSVSCRRCSPNAPFAKLEMLTAERTVTKRSGRSRRATSP